MQKRETPNKQTNNNNKKNLFKKVGTDMICEELGKK